MCRRLRKEVFLVCRAFKMMFQKKEAKTFRKKLKNFVVFLSEFRNATLMFIHSSSDLIVNKIHSR